MAYKGLPPSGKGLKPPTGSLLGVGSSKVQSATKKKTLIGTVKKGK
jgi:hypothetical protein